jgi:hypothetical protein
LQLNAKNYNNIEIERKRTRDVIEFGYEEPTSLRPTITNVNCVKSLKTIIILTNVSLQSLTLSKWVGNYGDNTSKENKSHEVENTQQSL